MKISPDAMIVVGALGVAAFLAAQDTRQEWKLSRSKDPDMVRFQVERSSPGHRSVSNWEAPLADFHGLNMNAGGVTHFEYVQDAGSLLCEGRFLFGHGSGTFILQADPRFAARLAELGYDGPTDEQTWAMLLARVSLEFARGVRDAGLRASTGQLIDLRMQGVTLSYIQGIEEAGHPGLTASDVIQMKIQGVSPDFVRELQKDGYDLPVSRIIGLKIQGVSASYIRDLKANGLKPSAEDLIQYKIQGVTPEYLKSFKDAGMENLDRNQIINLKIQGVTPEFARTSKELGFDFTPRELVDLKIQGVTGRYLRHLHDTGMRNLTASQIVKLKIHGVE
jgi:hypothetical protein